MAFDTSDRIKIRRVLGDYTVNIYHTQRFSGKVVYSRMKVLKKARRRMQYLAVAEVLPMDRFPFSTLDKREE